MPLKLYNVRLYDIYQCMATSKKLNVSAHAPIAATSEQYVSIRTIVQKNISQDKKSVSNKLCGNALMEWQSPEALRHMNIIIALATSLLIKTGFFSGYFFLFMKRMTQKLFLQ